MSRSPNSAGCVRPWPSCGRQLRTLSPRRARRVRSASTFSDPGAWSLAGVLSPWSGRVAVPGSAGEPRPSGGGADVDADEVGEDGWRGGRGEVQQGGVTAGPGGDPEPVHPGHEGGRLEVGAGVLAGEQPPAVGQGACGAEGLGDGQCGYQRVQGRNEQQGVATQGQIGVAGVGADVRCGEGDDLGDGLGVEQDKAARGPVLDARTVGIVQEPSDQVELLARVDVVPRVLAGDGFGQSGAGQVSAAFEPPDKTQPSVAVDCDPGIEADLGAVVQVVVVGGEVVEERPGGLDVATAPISG